MSQRYRSCGAGSGRRATRVGMPLRRGRGARPGRARPTMVGHSSASTCVVAVGAVELPRHDHRGVAPAGRAVEEGDRALPALGPGGRADVGDGPVGPLVGGDVPQPLGGEAGDVVEERGGRDVELPVAGPAGALPVRAVGRDVAGVAAQAPHGGLVQAVDPLVAAGEPAGAAQVGVHDDAADVVGRQSPGWPSMRTYRKPWVVWRGSNTSPGTPAETTRSTWPGRQRLREERQVGPQVVGGDVAVGSEPLAVGEGERRAGRAEVGQPDPAVDVLARGRRPAARRRAG